MRQLQPLPAPKRQQRKHWQLARPVGNHTGSGVGAKCPMHHVVAKVVHQHQRGHSTWTCSCSCGVFQTASAGAGIANYLRAQAQSDSTAFGVPPTTFSSQNGPVAHTAQTSPSRIHAVWRHGQSGAAGPIEGCASEEGQTCQGLATEVARPRSGNHPEAGCRRGDHHHGLGSRVT